jgi:hypothetical protein
MNLSFVATTVSLMTVNFDPLRTAGLPRCGWDSSEKIVEAL